MLPDEAIRQFADRYIWVRVNVDADQKLSSEYQVDALPTIVLLDDKGHVKTRLVGSQSANTLAAQMSLLLR